MNRVMKNYCLFYFLIGCLSAVFFSYSQGINGGEQPLWNVSSGYTKVTKAGDIYEATWNGTCPFKVYKNGYECTVTDGGKHLGDDNDFVWDGGYEGDYVAKIRDSDDHEFYFLYNNKLHAVQLQPIAGTKAVQGNGFGDARGFSSIKFADGAEICLFFNEENNSQGEFSYTPKWDTSRGKIKVYQGFKIDKNGTNYVLSKGHSQYLVDDGYCFSDISSGKNNYGERIRDPQNREFLILYNKDEKALQICPIKNSKNSFVFPGIDIVSGENYSQICFKDEIMVSLDSRASKEMAAGLHQQYIASPAKAISGVNGFLAR